MAGQRSNKRADIVEAAAVVIRTEGVHAASISSIIQASGTSAGTIYHHFASKNDIVLAVARAAVVEPMTAVIGSRPDEAMSPGDLLNDIVRTVMAGELESALIVQLWAGSSLEPHLKDILREQMQDLQAQITHRLALWLREQGCDDADQRAHTLALVTLGQAMGLLAQRTLQPDLDRAAYVVEATRLLDRACVPG